MSKLRDAVVVARRGMGDTVHPMKDMSDVVMIDAIYVIIAPDIHGAAFRTAVDFVVRYRTIHQHDPVSADEDRRAVIPRIVCLHNASVEKHRAFLPLEVDCAAVVV